MAGRRAEPTALLGSLKRSPGDALSLAERYASRGEYSNYLQVLVGTVVRYPGVTPLPPGDPAAPAEPSYFGSQTGNV